MNNNNTYEEYLCSLEEQITDKRAKQMVRKEFVNHIEEQTEAYLIDGMDEEQAVEEAVRQMGDPVEVGSQLNAIHRPEFPRKMFLIAVILSVMGVMTQILSGGLDQTDILVVILSTLLQLVIAVSVMNANYNYLSIHIGIVYAALLVLQICCSLIGIQLNNNVDEIYLSYCVVSLYPILFALVFYRFRNQRKKGIAKSLFACLTMIAATFILSRINFATPSNAAVIEVFAVMYIMLILAVWKGIFGGNKDWKSWLFLIMMGVAAILIWIVLFRYVFGRYGQYAVWRFSAWLNPTDENPFAWKNIEQRKMVGNLSAFGSESYMSAYMEADEKGRYLLGQIFTCFGVIPGVVLLGGFFLFLLLAFRLSCRQSNRIGFLLGMACTVSMSVRIFDYACINAGFGLWYTTSVPFFSSGWDSAVFNGIYLGILFSTIRNRKILAEPEHKKGV